MPILEFWFDFASTYSYLTAMRAESECARLGIQLVWRPFLLGPIFNQQGWNNSPFIIYPAKGRYMWKEMERFTQSLGLSEFRKPSAFPRNGLMAARVALAAKNEKWQGEFIRQVFKAEFEHDLDIFEPTVIQNILSVVTDDASEWIARAQTAEVKQALREQTDWARTLEIFGAPSFIVGGELYWGNDRFEDACAFALRRDISQR